MLQYIRNNIQGTLAKIVIAIIAVPFAAFGIDSLFSGGGPQDVAKVNGEEVSEFELAGAIQLRQRQLLNAMGNNIDPDRLEESRLRQPALDSLIDKKLMLQSADKLGIKINEPTVDQQIIAMEDFKQEGTFSPEIFQSVLQSNGWTPRTFKQLLSEELALRFLNTGLATTDFVVDTELQQLVGLSEQKRTFRYLTVPVEKVKSSVTVSQQDVDAFYQQNQQQYKTEPTVKLHYLSLLLEDFYTPISDDQLKVEYDREVADFTINERRRASHILLEINDSQAEAEALALAKKIRDEFNAGTNFAELAEKYSKDLGSASAGGDLGYSSGEDFGTKFDGALFALAEKNTLGEPVITDAGVHLIMATEIERDEAPSFEQRKVAISERLQKQKAEPEFLKKVETLKDLVFNSQGLQDAAEEMKLELKSSDWLTRTGDKGLFASNSLMAAAFSSDVLGEGNNSEVIEVSPGEYRVVSVLEHRPSEVKPLAEIEGDIRKQLLAEAAAEKTTSIADGFLGDFKKGESIEEIAKKHSYDWQLVNGETRYSAAVPREVLNFAFDLAPYKQGKVDDAAILSLRNGDAVVLYLEDVIYGQLDEMADNRRKSIVSSIERSRGNSIVNSFQDYIKKNADIKIH